jgi:crotonobetainyl-CoA:carnitine CoA-transferase CaiB-like acyl-CoA transferase
VRPDFADVEDIPRSLTMKDASVAENNIFSGLKVVDLASFIAGPSAAVILSDFGADVIKVEPPSGDPWRMAHRFPPQPQAKEPYQWHLANRNKRGITLDLKSPDARQVLERLVQWADVLIVNTPHPARKRLGLEYEDVVQLNPRLIYADLTGFGEKGPDADLPGFDITAYWARSGLLAMTRDAGSPPTWPVAGSGDNATAVGIYSAIVTGLYRRERTGKGSHVTTSLLAGGVWSASVSIQAALSGASFFGLHDRTHPTNAALNVYRASDGVWFVLIVTPDKLATVAKAIGKPDLLTDPRFTDPARLMQNMPQLAEILESLFSSQPMAHWYEVFSGAHVTFGAVRGPEEVISDPQLRLNDIVVPLEGAGDTVTSTISSPFHVREITKVPARRGPALGEHNEEVLSLLGFSESEIAGLCASVSAPKSKPARPRA